MPAMSATLSRPTTLRQVILQGADRFIEAGLSHHQGMPEAIDEAVYLCLSALDMPLDVEDQVFDTEISGDDLARVAGYFDQRIEQRRPASYITGRAMFAGLEFYVDERVLIPRSPFAELIGNHFRPWIDPGRTSRILDLCTGSGCIAIACAMAFPEAEVVASDVSADALEVAAINRQQHGLEQRLELVQSDLFDKLGGEGFDLIVSNPPYVSLDEMSELDAEFEHEPALGLAAGEHGLDLVIPMLQQARRYLNDDGVLFVELGYSWQELQQRLPDVAFMWLDFEYGGEGIFTLTAAELDRYQSRFDAFQL